MDFLYMERILIIINCWWRCQYYWFCVVIVTATHTYWLLYCTRYVIKYGDRVVIHSTRFTLFSERHSLHSGSRMRDALNRRRSDRLRYFNLCSRTEKQLLIQKILLLSLRLINILAIAFIG